MPSVLVPNHELFAPFGAASHAVTSYVRAAAGATPALPTPARQSAIAIEKRQNRCARAGAIESPFGVRVLMSEGKESGPPVLAPRGIEMRTDWGSCKAPDPQTAGFQQVKIGRPGDDHHAVSGMPRGRAAGPSER